MYFEVLVLGFGKTKSYRKQQVERNDDVDRAILENIVQTGWVVCFNLEFCFLRSRTEFSIFSMHHVCVVLAYYCCTYAFRGGVYNLYLIQVFFAASPHRVQRSESQGDCGVYSGVHIHTYLTLNGERKRLLSRGAVCSTWYIHIYRSHQKPLLQIEAEIPKVTKRARSGTYCSSDVCYTNYTNAVLQSRPWPIVATHKKVRLRRACSKRSIPSCSGRRQGYSFTSSFKCRPRKLLPTGCHSFTSDLKSTTGSGIV